MGFGSADAGIECAVHLAKAGFKWMGASLWVGQKTANHCGL
jgi:hypothetical protein